MGVVVQQHENSDGHKSKSRAIGFRYILHEFGVNVKNADDVVASEIAQIYHAVIQTQSFIQLT